MNRPSKLPRIIELADRAIRAAVHKVMVEHKQKHLPVYVWQHNKVVRIPPRRLPSH